ncbi:hypothetical protein HPB50_002002 [Hyalomma asiaticum]|uniref:Uncharacterized protein n=1 Tax=Hyalomma asiaticum TaxID=266040 RepID=A0ACB7S0B9_HYAAI|nr:hypothetical protein HPB50_002002 [Hyalomma asiaticum]
MGTSLKTGSAVLEEVGGDPLGYRSLHRALDEPALVCWLGDTQEGLPRLQSGVQVHTICMSVAGDEQCWHLGAICSGKILLYKRGWGKYRSDAFLNESPTSTKVCESPTCCVSSKPSFDPASPTVHLTYVSPAPKVNG